LSINNQKAVHENELPYISPVYGVRIRMLSIKITCLAFVHYLVGAFPTILPPKHGSETSAAFVLNIDKPIDLIWFSTFSAINCKKKTFRC
jgi:hypothetical protein